MDGGFSFLVIGWAFNINGPKKSWAFVGFSLIFVVMVVVLLSWGFILSLVGIPP